MRIVLVSNGRSLCIVYGWREALAWVRTARRMHPSERHTVRGASIVDLAMLPRIALDRPGWFV